MLMHLFILSNLFEPNVEHSFFSLRFLAQVFGSLWPAVVLLALNHGVLFFSDYIYHKKYTQVSAVEQMGLPYRRISITHVAMIACALLTQAVGMAANGLILLFLIKTFLDFTLREKNTGLTPA